MVNCSNPFIHYSFKDIYYLYHDLNDHIKNSKWWSLAKSYTSDNCINKDNNHYGLSYKIKSWSYPLLLLTKNDLKYVDLLDDMIESINSMDKALF